MMMREKAGIPGAVVPLFEPPKFSAARRLAEGDPGNYGYETIELPACARLWYQSKFLRMNLYSESNLRSYLRPSLLQIASSTSNWRSSSSHSIFPPEHP